MPPLEHFLIIFDTDAQELRDAVQLGADGDAAVNAYAEYEQKYRNERGIEIVLIGADSIDTIRRTHSQYFDAVDDFFAQVVVA
jgi:hypothetical protein